MSDTPEEDVDNALIRRYAAESGIEASLVFDLLALEHEFPDMGAWGAKTRLLARVTDAIVQASGKGPVP